MGCAWLVPTCNVGCIHIGFSGISSSVRAWRCCQKASFCLRLQQQRRQWFGEVARWHQYESDLAALGLKKSSLLAQQAIILNEEIADA